MARKRVYYQWDGSILYAMQAQDEKPLDAVLRSLRARTGAVTASVSRETPRFFRVALGFTYPHLGVPFLLGPTKLMVLN